jgi:hypothetical protein
VNGTVQVGGVLSPHGIFMHGGPGFRPHPFVRFALKKQYKHFSAEVAMNDTAGKWNGLSFVVIADGKEVWQSKEKYAGDAPERCEVDVTGVNSLTLEVRTVGQEMGAHGAWIEPRLTK